MRPCVRGSPGMLWGAGVRPKNVAHARRHTHTRTHARTHTQRTDTQTRTRAHTHTRTHAHTQAHAHTSPHSHTHTHTPTHRRTHAPPRTNAHAHTHTHRFTIIVLSAHASIQCVHACCSGWLRQTRGVARRGTRDSTRILWVRRQGPSWQTRSAPRVSHPSLLQSVWRPEKHMEIEKRGSHVTLVVTVVTTVVRWTCQQQGGERNGSTSGNHLSLLSGVAFGTWPFEAHALNTTWCGNHWHSPADLCFPLGLDRGELA